jgi:hypothetical protein
MLQEAAKSAPLGIDLSLVLWAGFCRPIGALPSFTTPPTAGDVGCILAPLRGWCLIINEAEKPPGPRIFNRQSKINNQKLTCPLC